MKTNPINLVRGKAAKPETTNILDTRLQRFAKKAVDARALIEIGTVAIDGALFFGYAKFAKGELDTLE